INPVCGICVPDFETGDMLYLTGRTEILIGKDANAYLPRSNLAVKLTLSDSRFVTQALPFRGEAGQRSPYNPVVRYLASEAQHTHPDEITLQQQAKLLSQVKLTPTISRFRFSIENAATYRPGQYVTLDFSEHLDIGYSHMRDDDPRSLNDDFVRTFTVSSPPGDPPNPVRRLKDDEFEITVRRVGVVTNFLFKQQGSEGTERASRSGGLEVGVKGFGGEFEVQQRDGETIGFIAAGVGITPLLPSLGRLEFSRLRLFWTVRVEDLGLVVDVLDQHSDLVKSLRLFVTNNSDLQVSAQHMERLRQMDVAVQLRRVTQEDVKGLEGDNAMSRYYLCTAMPLRKQLEQWLESKELVFEDFNF
ncbi:oxidoreductase, partial [Hortaea werneckii]